MKDLSLALTILISLLLALPSFAADACKDQPATVHGAGRASVEGALRQELDRFPTLAGRALTLRAETIKVGKAIKEKMDRAARDGDLKLITFYHDGKRVNDAPVVRMAELMRVADR